MEIKIKRVLSIFYNTELPYRLFIEIYVNSNDIIEVLEKNPKLYEVYNNVYCGEFSGNKNFSELILKYEIFIDKLLKNIESKIIEKENLEKSFEIEYKF